MSKNKIDSFLRKKNSQSEIQSWASSISCYIRNVNDVDFINRDQDSLFYEVSKKHNNFFYLNTINSLFDNYFVYNNLYYIFKNYAK